MLARFFTGTPYTFYCLLIIGLIFYAFSFHTKLSKHNHSFPLIFCFFLLLFARLPFIFSNIPFNPDESMQLAQAITIKKNPVVFEAWDGNTIGPLCTYLIMIPHALGLPLEFTTLHLMSIIFQFAFVWLLFQSLKLAFGTESAYWGTLPLIVWFAFTQHYDFVHYTSELPALVMLGVCTYVYFMFLKNKKLSYWWLFLQGFLSALIPFGKLQAVPLVFVVLLFTAIQLFSRNKNHFNIFLKSIGYLVIGGISALLIITSITLYWEVFDEMILFYFKGNLFHEAGGAKVSIWRRIINHFETTSDLFEFKAFIIYVIGLLVVFVLKTFNKTNSFASIYLYFAITLFIFGIYAVSKSGFRLYHYYHFLLLPLTIFAGFFSQKLETKTFVRIIVTVCTILLFLLPILPSIAKGEEFFRYHHPQRKMELSNVSKAILKYDKSGEYLAVWGWMQHYFVETQMPQATNDNHTIRCFTYSLINEHRKRFLNDLERTKPKVFVDAVAPSSFLMNNKEEFGIQNFPALKKYLDEKYTIVETVDGNDIYLRKK